MGDLVPWKRWQVGITNDSDFGVTTLKEFCILLKGTAITSGNAIKECDLWYFRRARQIHLQFGDGFLNRSLLLSVLITRPNVIDDAGSYYDDRDPKQNFVLLSHYASGGVTLTSRDAAGVREPRCRRAFTGSAHVN